MCRAEFRDVHIIPSPKSVITGYKGRLFYRMSMGGGLESLSYNPAASAARLRSDQKHRHMGIMQNS